MKKIWICKIGEIDEAKLPKGADAPMRGAISAMYETLTGEWPDFVFSGWGGELTPIERAVSENRHPVESEYQASKLRDRLMKFYAVTSLDQLLDSMVYHIEKLQEQLPSDIHPLISQVRD